MCHCLNQLKHGKDSSLKMAININQYGNTQMKLMKKTALTHVALLAGTQVMAKKY
jgi:hypothetical protein